MAGGGNSFRSLESSRRPWPPRRDGAGEVPAPTSAPCQGETGGHSRWASRMADTSTRTSAPHPGARRGTDRLTDRWTDKWEAPSPEGGRHREVSCGWFWGLISFWGHLLCPPVPLSRSDGVRTGGAEGSRPIFLLLAEQVGGPTVGVCAGRWLCPCKWFSPSCRPCFRKKIQKTLSKYWSDVASSLSEMIKGHTRLGSGDPGHLWPPSKVGGGDVGRGAPVQPHAHLPLSVHT